MKDGYKSTMRFDAWLATQTGLAEQGTFPDRHEVEDWLRAVDKGNPIRKCRLIGHSRGTGVYIRTAAKHSATGLLGEQEVLRYR
jgi:hypothetical protein